MAHYVAVAGRGELTDKAWAAIEPPLPPADGARGRWRDHRQVINGILWKLCTGAPWRDLPQRYGPWKTCHERLRRWTADGTWDKILARAQVRDDRQPVDWVVAVDSSVVRAHQHSAGARKKGAPAAWPASGKAAAAGVAVTAGEALGRSRGGLSTKIHLAVDGRGRPLSVLLSGGQAGDNPYLLPVLDAIAIRGPAGGRPRKRPDLLLADKGYAHDSTRAALRRRGIPTTSPSSATRSPAAPPGDHAAGGHLPSAGKTTNSATSWNAPSAGSNSGVTWPPATPNEPPSTGPAWYLSQP